MTEYSEEESAHRTKTIENITKMLEELGLSLDNDGEPKLKVVK